MIQFALDFREFVELGISELEEVLKGAEFCFLEFHEVDDVLSNESDLFVYLLAPEHVHIVQSHVHALRGNILKENEMASPYIRERSSCI